MGMLDREIENDSSEEFKFIQFTDVNDIKPSQIKPRQPQEEPPKTFEIGEIEPFLAFEAKQKKNQQILSKELRSEELNLSNEIETSPKNQVSLPQLQPTKDKPRVQPTKDKPRVQPTKVKPPLPPPKFKPQLQPTKVKPQPPRPKRPTRPKRPPKQIKKSFSAPQSHINNFKKPRRPAGPPPPRPPGPPPMLPPQGVQLTRSGRRHPGLRVQARLDENNNFSFPLLDKVWRGRRLV